MKWYWNQIGNLDIQIGDGNYSSKYPRSDEFVSEGVPFIRANNFKDKTITDDELYFISEKKHFQITKGHLKERDVLIITRGNIGEVALVPARHNGSNINAQIVLLRCGPLILPEFLLYVLTSSIVSRQISGLTTGTALKQLPVKNLKRISIPLPPLATQKKIAEILDAADAHRQKTKQLLAKYDELAQSIFLEMFGDPVTNPKGWEVKKLGELSKVSSGSTPKRDNDSNFIGEIPWVKTGEVRGATILDSEEKISDEALKKSSCRVYPVNTILIAMYGQGKTRGNVGILGIEATTNQACAAIPPSEKVNSKFLFYQLKMSYDQLRELGRGGNQPNLNTGLVKSFEILLPENQLQIEFESRIKIVESQFEITKTELRTSENLFNSLLQKAFKGGLNV